METKKYTGGCLCGGVRYELQGEGFLHCICHCGNCQKTTGSTFSCIVTYKPSDFRFLKTETLKIFNDKGDSGKEVHRNFCGTCGCPIVSFADAAPDMAFVKVGSLDDTSFVRPGAHLYTKSVQQWATKHYGDIPTFEVLPPRPE
jgi:hypothetical protein